jgi:hypothetical protein
MVEPATDAVRLAPDMEPAVDHETDMPLGGYPVLCSVRRRVVASDRAGFATYKRCFLAPVDSSGPTRCATNMISRVSQRSAPAPRVTRTVALRRLSRESAKR